MLRLSEHNSRVSTTSLGLRAIFKRSRTELFLSPLLFNFRYDRVISIMLETRVTGGYKIGDESEMVFLSWGRPSPQDQKACIHKSGTFNYDDKYKGATAKSLSSLKEDKGLSKDGFFINNTRVLVGSGIDTFEKGKSALQSWRHFGFNWAFVDPKTPVQKGVKFCVCVKELLPWLMMPLQVAYVNETSNSKNRVASFGFGSGTLHGHLLAGEERFSVEIDENNEVWYLSSGMRKALLWSSMV